MKLSVPVTLAALASGASACTFAYMSRPSIGCEFLWSLEDDIKPVNDPRMPTQEVDCKGGCVSTRVGAHDYELCLYGDGELGFKDGSSSATVRRLDGGNKVKIGPGEEMWTNGYGSYIYWKNNVGCPDLGGE